MMLVIVQLSLLLILSAAMYKIQKCQKTEATHNQTSFSVALNMIFRSLINKSIECKLKSWTYRILLLNVMTLGFIILTYYKAQMNAALNSSVEDVPLNSWKDILESNHELLELLSHKNGKIRF